MSAGEKLTGKRLRALLKQVPDNATIELWQGDIIFSTKQMIDSDSQDTTGFDLNQLARDLGEKKPMVLGKDKRQ